MNRWQNNVAVVTGASSGIGAAITKLLVEKGLKVGRLSRKFQEFLVEMFFWNGKIIFDSGSRRNNLK